MVVEDTGANPVDAAPVVDGAQPASVGNEAVSVEPPKLPGWTGQLTAEQQAEIKARVAADPKAVDELPKGLTELYSGYSQLKAQSVGAIKVPAQDAPKEAWDQFYKGLGRPESAEGYTFEKPSLPSGMRYDEAQEKWFRGLAHAVGLNTTQAKGIFEEWNKYQIGNVAKAQEGRKAAAKAATDALKAEWGDKFADNWEGVRQSYLQFIPEGQNGKLFKKIQAYGLDNDPDFLKMFRNIWTKIGPPKMVIPRGDGGGPGDKKGGFVFEHAPEGRA